jgi:antitoxin Phd
LRFDLPLPAPFYFYRLNSSYFLAIITTERRKEGLHMKVNTNNLVSITEANQNFSRIAKMVDKQGSVIILKNNAPRYILIDFNEAEAEQTVNTEDLMSISKRLISKNRKSYEVLAK